MTISSEATRGRGLSLVNAVASRWGIDPDRTGKTVWFEVVVAAGG